QLPGGHLPEREDQGGVSEMPRRGLRPDWLAGACVARDVEPLPSGGLDPAGEPGGRDALVAGHVCGAVQPAAPGAGASVPGALQEPDRGPGDRAGTAVPLHPSQSGAGQVAAGVRAARLCLDEPALVAATEAATGMV